MAQSRGAIAPSPPVDPPLVRDRIFSDGPSTGSSRVVRGSAVRTAMTPVSLTDQTGLLANNSVSVVSWRRIGFSIAVPQPDDDDDADNYNDDCDE